MDNSTQILNELAQGNLPSELMAPLSDLIALPSFILMAAALIEMWLPLPRSWRLSRLLPLFQALGNKVNRPERQSAERYFAGILLPLLLSGVLLFLLLLLLTLAGFEIWLSLVLLILLLELQPHERLATSLNRLLRKGDLKTARKVLQPYVLRDTAPLSELGIIKAGCECLCLRLFSSWFAVLTWYLILDIEGAFIMQCVFVLNSAFNAKLPQNSHFGLGSRRVLQAMLLPPALLYALLHLFNMRGFAQIRAGLTGARSCTAAPCSGFILSLSACSLNISLGGPRYYAGNLQRFARLGGRLEPQRPALIRMLSHLRFYGFLLICLSFALKIALSII